MKKIQRSSGVLLHLTSLPATHGIGCLGHGARIFIDFLAEASQSWWQFMPSGPTSPGFGNSPYMSLSAFAGNPLLIDLSILAEEGLLSTDDLAEGSDFSQYSVDYDRVIPLKNELLQKAYISFKRNLASQSFKDDFNSFCTEHWLEDYALYMSLRDAYSLKPWYKWPRPLAARRQNALRQALKEHNDRVTYYKFEQYCFYSQWKKLRQYAGLKNIGLIGDIPYYIGLDSADVWANQDLFKLDDKGKPTHIAGVPPDYFSITGQRWGNPIYQWFDQKQQLNQPLLQWWQKRLEHIFSMVDMIRIDHFRGFESFWQIQEEEETAINGEWVAGPGQDFFNWMQDKLGDLPIIAEDLGIITPEVTRLREGLGFPGMKVLHFAFDGKPDNLYLPHNYDSTSCVVYTGTHDNNTTLGWFLSDQVTEQDRATIRRYAHMTDDNEVHWALISLAFSSIADLAVVPMQDVLGFGEDCRMNLPGTGFGNWQWRLAEESLTTQGTARLKEVTEFYNRIPKQII
jgi:4-alpha-glucanotransferase